MKLFKWITINGLQQMDYDIWIASITIFEFQKMYNNQWITRSINFFKVLDGKRSPRRTDRGALALMCFLLRK